MASTYEPIATNTLASATASVTFSSIPQTYTDLVCVVMAQKTASGSGSGYNIRFNGVSTTDYSTTYLEGSGGSASSYRATTQPNQLAGALTSNAVASHFDVNTNQVMNYANTTTYKTTLTRYNDNEYGYLGAGVSLFARTEAINSVTFFTASTFAIGCTFTIYGIKAA